MCFRVGSGQTAPPIGAQTWPSSVLPENADARVAVDAAGFVHAELDRLLEAVEAALDHLEVLAVRPKVASEAFGATRWRRPSGVVGSSRSAARGG